MILFHKLKCSHCKVFMGYQLLFKPKGKLCNYCKCIKQFALFKKGLECWDDAK